MVEDSLHLQQQFTLRHWVSMNSNDSIPVGTPVVIVTKRLPEYTRRNGIVARILPNPEGIEILDEFIVRFNKHEAAFRRNELRIANRL
jgi:hypothetical protein